MGVLPPFLAHRPVRTRVLILYRIEPAALSRLLPDSLRPRLFGDTGVGVACFTRLGGRLLSQKGADTDHLSYRFAVEVRGRGGLRPGTWVPRRETSSRLGARWNELLGRQPGRARFELEEAAFGLSLRVTGDRGEELLLRAEASNGARGARFASARDVAELLETSGEVLPPDRLAPEADALQTGASFAPEPLSVFEVRSAFLEESGVLPRGSLALDGAWRLVSRRLQPVRRRSTRLRSILEPGGSQPAPAP